MPHIAPRVAPGISGRKDDLMMCLMLIGGTGISRLTAARPSCYIPAPT